MRNAGAARRREQEPPPPPAGAAAEAELRRVIAAADAALGRISRREGEIAAIAAALRQMGFACGNAERFAVLAGKLADRQSLQIVESISCAAHVAEAREAAGQLAAAVAFSQAMYDAALAEGRRREAEERDSAGQRARPSRPRHGRPSRLMVVTGTAAAAVTVLGAGGAIAARDSAQVRFAAAGPARHARLYFTWPVAASLLPPQPSRSPSPRRSAAVKSATPAPSVTVTPGVPSPSLSPPPPPPSLPPPVLLGLPATLDLGAVTRGPLVLRAGARAVTWTLAATDGIQVLENGVPVTAGRLVPGQELDLTVQAPLGHGWVYFSAGPRSWAVKVTSAVGA